MTARRSISTKERLRLFALHGGPHPMKTKLDLDERSMPEPNSGCWIWLGASKAKGYGHFYDGSSYRLAHRFAYEIYKGPIPHGMVVMHNCDMPCCVNPNHLRVGTTYDNIHDCINKGRAKRGRLSGEQASQAKLKWSDIKAIRSTPKYYGYRRDLSLQYGVSASTISKIFGMETWCDEA